MAADLFSLAGKNIVVIGGGGGMGRAVAKGMLEYGGTVVLADVSVDGMASAAEWLKSETGKDVAKTYQVTATDEADVEKLVASIVADLGSVEVLINAHGWNVKSFATEFPMDKWSTLFDINVKSFMITCKHFGAQMIKQGKGGKIINFSSVRGQRAAAGGNAGYCATKGAVDMITRVCAVEFAKHGICVNALGPINTKTPMTAEMMEREKDGRYANFLKNVPMGRFGEVDDLIGPAVFLASAASDFITGSIIYPDGGAMAFL